MRNSTELRARRHYRLRGFRILGENVWIGGYELDLVVRRGKALVFCEVKGKSGPGFGDPLEMVDAEKRRRLRRAAPPGSRLIASTTAATSASTSSPSARESSSASRTRSERELEVGAATCETRPARWPSPQFSSAA